MLKPADDLADASAWVSGEGYRSANDFHAVTVDPIHGGTVSELVDVRTGRNLLAAGALGNELVVYDEYPDYPTFKEGPWHLLPSGPFSGSAATEAETITQQRSALGQRVTSTGRVGLAPYTKQVTLQNGVDRVEFTTWIDDWEGSDQLVRVRFPTPIRGALPVCEVTNAVIGRGFGFPDVDSAEATWTLDNPAYT